MVIRIFPLLVFILCCSISRAEDAVEISLGDIWTYHMPGTKFIADLDPFYAPPDVDGAERRKLSVVRKIIRDLAYPLQGENKRAGQGFAVKETGIEALKRAEQILTGNKEPDQTFSTEDEITLFIYARHARPHIHSIRRQGTAIKIQYYLRSIDPASGVRFALIPLGKLPPDHYTVAMTMKAEQVEGNSEEQHKAPISRERLDEMVCQDFVFDVH